jgi:hypothetical protein
MILPQTSATTAAVEPLTMTTGNEAHPSRYGFLGRERAACDFLENEVAKAIDERDIHGPNSS